MDWQSYMTTKGVRNRQLHMNRVKLSIRFDKHIKAYSVDCHKLELVYEDRRRVSYKNHQNGDVVCTYSGQR